MSFFTDLKHKSDKEKHRASLLFAFVIFLFVTIFWLSHLNATLPSASSDKKEIPSYSASVSNIFEAGLRSSSESIITGLANSYVYFSNLIK